MWPKITINTIAKTGQPNKNALVKHEITGNIVDPHRLSDTAHRITVCEGTFVRSVITAPGGFPATNTASGSLDCTSNSRVCEGTVNVKEAYTSVNQAGSDTDTITLIPSSGSRGQ